MKNDLLFSLRLLARAPGWTIVIVLSLVLGIAANAVIFSLVDSVLLKPLPYRDPEQLVLLWGSKSESSTRGISGPDLRDWREQSHSFSEMDAFLGKMTFSMGTEPADTVSGACLGSRVLPLLGVQPALGRNFTEVDERVGAAPVVLLSEALWRTRFAADTGIVNRSIHLGDQAYEVIGVMPTGFFFPDTDTRLWIAAPCGLTGFERRGAMLLHAVGRLKPGISATEAQLDLDSVNRRLAHEYPDTNSGTITGVFPLQHVVVGKFERALWLLLAAVAVVLLIACANVAHLQLARGLARETELAVRAALGADRTRLLRQLLTESAVLVIIAATLGVLLASPGLRAINAIGLNDVPRMSTAAIDLRVLVFVVIVSLITGLVSGLWPAWKTSGVRLSETLKSGGLAVPHHGRGQIRDVLAISEIAAAILLLVVAGLAVRSFVHLSQAKWGFNPDKLLLIDVDVPPEFKKQRDPADSWADSVISNLRAIDGIEHASRSDSAPIRWSAWKSTDLSVDGQPVTRGWAAGAWVVGDGYFATTGIPLVEGREFTENDTASSPSRVVISQALARRIWPNGGAIGKHLELLELKTVNGQLLPEIVARIKRHDPTLEGDFSVLQPVEGKSWEVIGIAGDVRMFSLDVVPKPALYIAARQNPRSRMWGMDMSSFTVKFLMRTRGRPTEAASAAQAAIRGVNRGAHIKEVASMQDLVSATIGGRGTNKLMLVVSAMFGALSLTFAVIGIYGVVSHTIAQRLREMGVRMALGAGRADVSRLVMAYVLRLLALGVALGLIGAWGVTRGLQTQLSGVTVTDLPTYAGAVAILSCAVLAACVSPLRRALRYDPVVLFRA
jgi:predicted permease